MNLSKKLRLPNLPIKKVSQNYLLWAFVIPCFSMLVVMLLGAYEPFGNNYAMLYSDQYHQYYPFFVAFRKALLNGQSLLYSWDVGMGLDYLGLISYYLASPLNLLSVLVPESLTLEYFALLTPIKLGLAGLFFAIFLKNVFQKNDLSISIFGGFYGLCAWALGYQWNVMWLDTFALLPLVALGTVWLLRDKKFILYTITLFLSIFANYYIGLFTCIFVLLLFICYEICRFPGIKRFVMDLGRIALFSMIAIGMTAVLELPALAALQNTQSSVNTFPDGFSLNMVEYELCTPAREAWALYKSSKEAGAGGMELLKLYFDALKQSFAPIMDGMRQTAGNIGGCQEPTFKEGLPNLYCGVGTLVLAFLFLTAKEIKLRDKICSVLLLIFFMLSFILRQLDYIWHGFHFTNMIPYRFSFLFSFVMLYMAYRAWLLRDSFKLWQLIVSGILSVGILMCSDQRGSFVYLSYNLSILLLFLGVCIYAIIERKLDKQETENPDPVACARRQTRQSKQITAALTIVMAVELVLNVANFGIRFPATSVTNYPKGTEDSASAIRYMQEREKYSDFFRAEVTHNQTLNDGAINGYNGITTFTSSANVRVTEFMEALGYGARNTYNRYSFEEASPVSNLFLNLKYMIERDGDVEPNRYFDTIHHFGDVYLLKNNAYLPMGFLAENSLSELDVQANGNNFYFQNNIFKLATGLDENVWSILSSRRLSVSSSDITLSTQTASGFTSYTADTSSGILRYTYKMDRDGFLCLDMNMSARNSFRVYKNGKELYSESLSLPQMLAVSDVVLGDTIMIEITCYQGEKGTVNIRAGVLDDEVFRNGYNILAASTLDLTDFSNTHMEGTITCNRDGLLYTSIPYDGNWVATVDGEAAEVVRVGECMIGLPLTEGDHTITFTYRNEAFTAGLLISLFCTGAFAGLIVLFYSSPKTKGKYRN
jgi:uncharacterized membrane protein YfhO